MTVALNQLSASTSGRPIKVAATATPGTLLHTHSGTGIDRIFLQACNTSTTDVKLTLEIGGTTSPDDTMEITVAGESGFDMVLSGALLEGSLSIRAFAATADVINIIGEVQKVT